MTAGAGRVLLVVGHAAGGIGRHVLSLADGVPRHGWAATVVCPSTTARRFPFPNRDVTAWPGGGPAQRWRALRRLRAWVAGADVVHAHGHQAGLLALLAAATVPRSARPPVVVSWHNAVLGSGPRRRVLAWLERLQARHADLLTGASDDLVERARSLGARDAEPAPVAAPAPTWRGAHDAERGRVAAELGLDPTARWALTVSRIAPQKNLDVLVDAAAVLRAEPLEWVVVGDGDPGLAAALRDRVARTGVPVHLVGARDDVPRLMALADLFVLPSAWEARALVVQEAMAAGTPVVATDVGGLPGLLGGTGLLVPPGDPVALADAVRRVLADPELAARMAADARRRYAGLPDEEAVRVAWAARYDRLRGLSSGRSSGKPSVTSPR